MDRQLLIVDDDEDLRTMLEAHFTGRGYACQVAADGVEALGVLRGGQIQVMVTDLDMPRMNGLALLRAVREQGVLTRCVVMTGYASIGNLTACLQEGATALLAKPFERLELLDQAVDQACEQMQRWRDQMTAIVRLRSAGGA